MHDNPRCYLYQSNAIWMHHRFSVVSLSACSSMWVSLCISVSQRLRTRAALLLVVMHELYVYSILSIPAFVIALCFYIPEQAGIESRKSRYIVFISISGRNRTIRLTTSFRSIYFQERTCFMGSFVTCGRGLSQCCIHRCPSLLGDAFWYRLYTSCSLTECGLHGCSEGRVDDGVQEV